MLHFSISCTLLLGMNYNNKKEKKMKFQEIKSWYRFNRLPVTCRECYLIGLCRREYSGWSLENGYCFLRTEKVISCKFTLKSMLAPKYFKTKAGNLDEYPVPALYVALQREVDKEDEEFDETVFDRCLELIEEKDPRMKNIRDKQ